MFHFTPLLGAQTSSPACQSLLELDGGIKILIDVGWDERFDAEDLGAIERHTKSLSFILLTHATTSHLAAFAHCCKNIPLFTQIPIYATAPVISLGRTLLQEIYSSTPLASTIIPQSSINKTSFAYQNGQSADVLNILLQPPSTEDIAGYFNLVNPLRYSQPHQPLPSPFSPPLNDLTITAYNAGHSLGGTIWHIQHGMESIVYAVDWSQLKENVYSGAAWLRGSGGTEVIDQLRKPTALVCSAKGAEKTAITGGRAKRDNILIELIRSCIARSGTVLIPTDTCARALELAYVLEHAWRKEAANQSNASNLKSAKLYMASRSFDATMRYASSMLEWMEDSVLREFEFESANSGKQQHKRSNSKHTFNQHTTQTNSNSGGPFEFKFLKKVRSRKRVEKLLDGRGPRVILASDSSLAWGFSKDILEQISTDPDNLVILTEDLGVQKAPTGRKRSLRESLWQCFRDGKMAMTEEIAPDGSILEFVKAGGSKFELVEERRATLDSRELYVHQQYLATQQQAEDYSRIENRTILEASGDAEDEASSSSSSDDESDPERQGKALNSTFKTSRFNKAKTEPSKEALGVNVLLRYPGVYDFDVRERKGRDQTFPAINTRKRNDDFGELIKPEDYLRAEERDETDAPDLRDESKKDREGLGQKRKWQETQLQGDAEKRSTLGSSKTRRQRAPKENGSAVTNDRRKHDGTTEESELSAESDTDLEEGSFGPSRLEVLKRPLEISFRIAFVDFAGIHDQRSLSMLIPLIQPSKLILTAGTSSETTSLAQECGKTLSREIRPDSKGEAEIIFTPTIGQTVDASVDTNAWSIRLSDALSRQLHWQNVRGLGVVTLAGQLAATLLETEAEGEGHSRKKMKLENAGLDIQESNAAYAGELARSEASPILDVLPPSMVAAPTSIAQPLHVGDLRLADLRKILQNTGHTAEFRGAGTLLIDQLVAVRKSAMGKIELENGSLSSKDKTPREADGAFYAVKKRIYDGLAIIAGG